MYYRLPISCLLLEKDVYPECIIVCQLSVCLLLEKGVYPECIIVCQLSICCLKIGFTLCHIL